jgi:hypothetical protein
MLQASCLVCVLRQAVKQCGGRTRQCTLNYEEPDKERSIQSDNTGADARDLAPSTGCHEVWEVKPK